ncbi:lambda exonuclease family protein [Castellaniella sp.]|uniref:lambda exonuclease family protein n=1 Tax=Castellaniella sp. TaxID=1955812 RepID=UPI002AFF092B|nr:YqaJ viral recombinase family protein [Castellaniella sp.]
MLQIINCEQGTPEWFAARAGIPTASQFATVMASGRGGGESKTRRTYMLKLAGEILTNEPSESYGNVHTERGHAMEPEARDLYAFMRDVEPELIGFIRNGDKGASPDALIGTDGALEIKTKAPHIMIECLLKDEFPSEHKAQCQGVLWVAEREWIDLCVYWPKLPPLIKRAYRDEVYISDMAKAVDAFNSELADLVGSIRRMDPANVQEAA